MANDRYLLMKDAIARYEESEFAKQNDPRCKPLHISHEVMKSALREFRIGELTVLGGCEGHGKSALALQLALDLARDFSEEGFEKRARAVLYCSLEMDTTILMDRAKKQLEIEDDFARVAGDLPFITCDQATLTTDGLDEMIRDLKTEYDPKLVVVDYIQILSDRAPDGDSVAKYDLISKNLKEIARRHKLHVLSLASLNRSGDNYLPNNQNLRGSQQIAFNADNTMFVHQSALSDHSLDSIWKSHVILKVDKQRSGKGGGMYYLRFDPMTLKFKKPDRLDEDKLKLAILPSRRNFGA